MIEAVTVMLRAEYELYVAGTGSPRLTWMPLNKRGSDADD